MIAVVDSGSTKADWTFLDSEGKQVSVQTKGLNPFYISKEEIIIYLKEELSPYVPEDELTKIYFYGAGCTPEKGVVIQEALENLFTTSVEVYSDLLGAARCLLGDKKGIACILGTGSNSCYFDGKDIIRNVSPLGFILGDEGSGAYLGKIFLSDLLKGLLDNDLSTSFLKDSDLDMPTILNRVYKQPFPNRFLATIPPFLSSHIENRYVQNLIYGSFTSFIKRNVLQYDIQNDSINFVGSVAYHFKEILEKALLSFNLKLGEVQPSPIQGLVDYHSKLLNN